MFIGEVRGEVGVGRWGWGWGGQRQTGGAVLWAVRGNISERMREAAVE